MIDLNVRVLTELSLAFVDSLARHQGGILNVGSMAGFLPGPGMAVYYATKAYVLSFSEALHSELKPRGIKVAVLCPGPVPTEFAERRRRQGAALAPRPADQERRVRRRGRLSRPHGRPPHHGARARSTKLVTVIVRLVPRRLLLWAVGSPAEPAQGRAGHIAAARLRKALQIAAKRR